MRYVPSIAPEVYASSVRHATPTVPASQKAGLGVGHIWWETRCPAYRTLNPTHCTCKKEK